MNAIGKCKLSLAAGALSLCALGGILWGAGPAAPRSASAAENQHPGWTHEVGGEVLNEQTAALKGGKKYYLSGDVTLTEALSVEGEVEICLNGYELNLSGGGSISIYQGGSLTLWDCEGGGQSGSITGATDTPITIYNGTFTMNGGKITGNNAEYGSGGGVFVRDGTFTMNGGEISNNTASAAADVGQDYYAGGGGIYVMHGTVQINGGVISDNAAPNGYGGGILLNATEAYSDPETQNPGPPSIQFTLSGDALIANNTATGGGGIAMIGGVTAAMTGGTIGGKAYANGQTTDGNKSTADEDGVGGGGVYLKGTTLTYGNDQITADLRPAFTVSGGTIGYTLETGASATAEANGGLGNSAVRGGGVFVSENAEFTLSGNGMIGFGLTPEQYEAAGTPSALPYGNTTTPNGYAEGGGGGVQVWSDRALFKMSGGTLSYNDDTGYGDGVSVHNDSNIVPATYAAFEFSGGTVVYHKTGIFCKNGGTLNMSGGAAVRSGGLGVELYSGGMMEMGGGTITECTVGVMLQNMMSNYETALALKGGRITGNETGITGTAAFTLGGAPVVKENFMDGVPQNFMFRGGTVTLLADFSGGDVGITFESISGNLFTTGYREGMEAFFTVDGVEGAEPGIRLAPVKTWVPDAEMQPVAGAELALAYHIDFMDGERTISALSGDYVAGGSFHDSILYDPLSQGSALTDDTLQALAKEPDGTYHYTFAAFCDEEGTPYPNFQYTRVEKDGVVRVQYTAEEHLFGDWSEGEGATLTRSCGGCAYRETIADERPSFDELYDGFEDVTGDDRDRLNDALDRYNGLGEGERKFLDEAAQQEGYSGFEGMMDDLLAKSEFEAEREDTLDNLGNILRGCDGREVRQEFSLTIETVEGAVYERCADDDYRLEYLAGCKEALATAVRVLENIRIEERAKSAVEAYLLEKQESGCYSEEALGELRRIAEEIASALGEIDPKSPEGGEALERIRTEGLSRLDGVRSFAVVSGNGTPEEIMAQEYPARIQKLYGYATREGGFRGGSALSLLSRPADGAAAKGLVALFGVAVRLTGDDGAAAARLAMKSGGAYPLADESGTVTVCLLLPEDARGYTGYRVMALSADGVLLDARVEGNVLTFETDGETDFVIFAERRVALGWLITLLGCLCGLETVALGYVGWYFLKTEGPSKRRAAAFAPALLAVVFVPASAVYVCAALGGVCLLEGVAIGLLLAAIRKREKARAAGD